MVLKNCMNRTHSWTAWASTCVLTMIIRAMSLQSSRFAVRREKAMSSGFDEVLFQSVRGQTVRSRQARNYWYFSLLCSSESSVLLQFQQTADMSWNHFALLLLLCSWTHSRRLECVPLKNLISIQHHANTGPDREKCVMTDKANASSERFI